MDKAINDAMLNYYGPLSAGKKNEIKEISTSYTSRRNGHLSQSLGSSIKTSTLMNQKKTEHLAS